MIISYLLRYMTSKNRRYLQDNWRPHMVLKIQLLYKKKKQPWTKAVNDTERKTPLQQKAKSKHWRIWFQHGCITLPDEAVMSTPAPFIWVRISGIAMLLFNIFSFLGGTEPTELMFSWLRLALSISGVIGVGVPFARCSLYKTYSVQQGGHKSDRNNS